MCDVLRAVFEYLTEKGFKCSLEDRGDFTVEFPWSLRVTLFCGDLMVVSDNDVIIDAMQGRSLSELREANRQQGSAFFELADPKCFDQVVEYLVRYVDRWK